MNEMIVTEEPAQVIEVVGNRAKIRVTRLSVCAKSHCQACDKGHCSVLPSDMDVMEAWVDNQIGVKPGDWVQVGMNSRHFLLGVGVIFGLPLIGLLFGILFAWLTYPHFPCPLSLESWEALLGIIGLGLSLLSLRKFKRYVLRKPGFHLILSKSFL